MFNYVSKIVSDSSGEPSSKRWVTIVFSLTLCGAFISSIVLNTKADPEIVHAIMYVIIAGLGMTGAERFAPK